MSVCTGAPALSSHSLVRFRSLQVRAQNRSHYVTSQSHAQFKGLDRWVEEHSWALCQLLEPEVEVLFGEWCYARHTVAPARCAHERNH